MDEKQAKSLQEKIKLAESSLAGMAPDSPLREKAFELILTSLLQNSGHSHGNNSISIADRKTSAKKRGGKIHPIQKNKSELQFTQEQLQELKEFYDKHEPSGREPCLFVIANYMRLKLEREKFSEEDIGYSYQQLLNLRTKNRPPAMNSGQIRQTISWLIAPSRKKQWIEIGDDGTYQVSSIGKIRFNEMEDEIEKRLTSGTNKDSVGEKK